MADRMRADQRAQIGLVEDLRHQAHVLVRVRGAPVAGGDAGAFLAAMLQRIQPEIRQPGDIAAGGKDPEYAALVVGFVVVEGHVHGFTGRG